MSLDVLSQIRTDVVKSVLTSVLGSGVSRMFGAIWTWVRSPRAPRKLKTRAADRRHARERRSSPMKQRLRRGFNLQYYRATAQGEYQPLKLDPYTQMKAEEALLPEARTYVFADRHSKREIPPELVLNGAINTVWSRYALQNKREDASILVIEELASYIYAEYDIASRDRRSDSDRRSSAE